MKHQNLKIVFTLLPSVALVSLFVVKASAQTITTDTTTTDTSSTTTTDVKSALDEYKKAATAKRLEALKKVSNKMIDVRIKDKNNIKTRMTNNKCLAETDKNSILSDITNTVGGLTALKTKIDAATTVNELKPLVHSIRTDYRVYMVEIPREHGLVAVCRAEKAKAKFDELVIKIQAEINKAKNNGKDTTTAQAKLDEAKVQLDEAGQQTAVAREKFTAMKVASGDAVNKELRTAGHTALKFAHDAFHEAKELFVGLKSELRKLVTTTTGSPNSSQ
jgi:hypothetical protein